ncbi:MAG: hypothetical protein ACJAZ3_001142, partial [Sphingobacteriales bacterium]
SVELSLDGPVGAIQWQVDTNGTFVNIPGGTTTPYTYTHNGPQTYNFRAYVTKGECVGDTSNTVTTIVDSTSVASAANVDEAQICNSTASVELSLDGPVGAIQWQVDTNGTFVNIPGGTTTPYTYTHNGPETYYFRAYVTKGECVGDTSNTVTTIIRPAATAEAGDDTTVCETDVYKVTGASIGGGATSFTWTENGAGLLSNENTLSPTYTPLVGTGTETVTLTLTTNDPEGACPQVSDFLTINVQERAIVDAGSNATICESESYTINNATIGGSATEFNWSIKIGSGTLTDATTATPTYTPTAGNGAETVELYLTTDDPARECEAAIDSMTINVDEQAEVNAGPDQTICSDTTATMAAVIGGSTLTIAWTSDGTGSFDDTTKLDAVYTPSNADILAGSVEMHITTNNPGTTCDSVADTLTLTIDGPAPGIATADADSICQDDAVIGLSLANSDGDIQWQHSFNGAAFANIPGAITANFNYTYTGGAGQYIFRAQVSPQFSLPPSDCDSAFSNLDSTYVLPIPIGGIATADVDTICAGEPNIELTLANHSGAFIQWQVSTGGSFTNIVGATDTTHTFTHSGPANYVFRARISGNSNCDTAFSSSDSTKVILGAASGFASTDEDSICTDQLTVGLTTTGSSGPIQWQVDQGLGLGFQDIPLATSTTATYTHSGPGKYYFRVRVTSLVICADTFSNVDSTVVSFLPIAGVTQSDQDTICLSRDTIQVTLTGSQGNIKWQVDIESAGYMDISGETNDTLTYVPEAFGVFNFRAYVFNPGCDADTSTVTQIVVTDTPYAGPITAQDTACVNDGTVTLTLDNPSGTIQWQVNGNGIGFIDIDGEDQPELTYNIDSAGTFDFRSVVSNGVCLNDTSDTATIIIDTAAIGGIVTAHTTPVCQDTTSLDLTLTGSVGNVQWQVSKNDTNTFEDIAGATDTFLFYTNFGNDPGTYYFRAVVNSQNNACVNNTSNIDSITVDTTAVGGTAIASNTLVCDTTTTLEVTLAGQVGKIQWQVSKNDTNSFADIAGATSENLAYTGHANDPGKYYFRAVVSSQNEACPAATSTMDTIVVDTTAVGGNITPLTTSVCVTEDTILLTLSNYIGNSITWEVNDGSGYVSAGSTADTLDYDFAGPGTYNFRAIVTNLTCGPDTSDTATITVNDTPFAGSIASEENDTICEDVNPIQLTLTDNVGTIQWKVSRNNGTFTNFGSGLKTEDFTHTQIGEYVFMAISTSGQCPPDTSNFDTVVVDSIPSAGTASTDADSICENDPDIQLTLVGSFGEIQWQLDTGMGFADISGATNTPYTFVHSGANSYNFRAITSNGVCDNDASFTVTTVVMDSAEVNAGEDDEVCIGNSYTLNGSFGGGATSIIWTTSGGGLFDDDTEPQATYTPSLLDISAGFATLIITTQDPIGPCEAISDTMILTIDNGQDVSLFSYDNVTYCQEAPNPTAIVVGYEGTFSATPTGLTFVDYQTGEIDLQVSLPGNYTITQITNGGCNDSSTATVIIQQKDSAIFEYDTNRYCINGTVNPTPTNTGTQPGVYTGTIGLTVNPVTGEITLATTTLGNHTVTYTTIGICPDTAFFDLLIFPADIAGFDYGQTAFVRSEAPVTPTKSNPAQTGTFSSTPVGLDLNPSDGTITPANSAIGDYDVTLTTDGVCQNDSTITITIVPRPVEASFVVNVPFRNGQYEGCLEEDIQFTDSTRYGYPSYNYLWTTSDNQSSTDQNPIFSFAAGTYDVTLIVTDSLFNIDDTSVVITIDTMEDAEFTYGQNFFCQYESDTNPLPILNTPGTQGIYTSTPAGLELDLNSGQIDLLDSDTGNYVVKFRTSGVCRDSFELNVTIHDVPDPKFTFDSLRFCKDDLDPIAILNIDTVTGTFSSTSGLVFLDTDSGKIDLSKSTAGTYSVKFLTDDPFCKDSSFITITIDAVPDPTFDYEIASICQYPENDNPIPTRDITVTGSFSATPDGLIINATSGEIDLQNSDHDTYTITYLTDHSFCPRSYEQKLIIDSVDNPTFSYDAAKYCKDDEHPTAIVDASNVSGRFISIPSGIVFEDSTTGLILLDSSTVGTYSIRFTTEGTCIDSFEVDLEIIDRDDPGFTYGVTSFCPNDNVNPRPLITGGAMGTFSSTAGLVFESTSTGEINFDSSTPGTYVVKFVTNGFCLDSATETITIEETDDVYLSYGRNDFCEDEEYALATFNTPGRFRVSPSGLFITKYTGEISIFASDVGAYTITLTTEGSCPSDTSITVRIIQNEIADFTYNKAAYCTYDQNPFPNKTDPGAVGKFTSSAGLAINSVTGEINTSGSTPGDYFIKFVTTDPFCSDSDFFAIRINLADDPAFDFDNAAYCQYESNPQANIIGGATGTFKSLESGLIFFNDSSGIVNLGASTPGDYTIRFVTDGICPDSFIQSFRIDDAPSPTFNYSFAEYCDYDTDPIAIKSPDVTGTFSATPAGLVFRNTATGKVDLDESTVGTYTIKFVTDDICPDSATTSFTINLVDDPSFAYSSQAFCKNETNPEPTISGTKGGVFRTNNAGLVIKDTLTGEINLLESNTGSFTLRYVTLGTCPDSLATTITIHDVPSPAFTFAQDTFCTSEGTTTPNIPSGTDGTFSSSAGLVFLDNSTGKINLTESTQGQYIVKFVTGDINCPDSTTRLITIITTDDPAFSYANTAYCVYDSDPNANISGGATGIFTSSPAGLVFLNDTTGSIDLSESSPNTYSIKYVTDGICLDSSAQSITINGIDSALFNYAQMVYCAYNSDPSAIITNGTTGTFKSTTGLVFINTSNGTIDLDESTPGMYSVKYVTNGFCPDSNIFALTINAVDSSIFTYSSSSYCQYDTDPIASITGATTGGFISIPSGVVFADSTTGKINLTASTVGIYDIQFATIGDCPDTSIVSLTILAVDNPSFNYASATYCKDETGPSANISGGSVGVFTAAPAGLVFTNTAKGQIDLKASAANNYIIQFLTNGTCPDSTTFALTVVDSIDASFAYGKNTYCKSEANPTPGTTTAGGTFSSSPSGLVFVDTATAKIDVLTSSAGSYMVYYTFSGTCPKVDSVKIDIVNVPDASFTYSADSFCTGDVYPNPDYLAGASAGNFTATPEGLVFANSQGRIKVSATTAGIYKVYNSIPEATGCPASLDSTTVKINSNDIADFTFASSQYCQYDSDPTASISGLTGGSFSSIPNGVVFSDSSAGTIDLDSSSIGTFMIKYVTAGICPDSAFFSVTIDSVDDATFTFAQNVYCQYEADPTALITGEAGGSFTSIPNGVVFSDSTLGTIDLDFSATGTFQIQYITDGTCIDSATFSITINSVDNAAFTFAASQYCQYDANPTASITGLTGGSFRSSPTGVVFSYSTEVTIDLTLSAIGTFDIWYLTNGDCPDSTSFTITIDSVDDATFTFAQNVYCQYDADPTASITGEAGGSFTSIPNGVVFIDSTLGTIDLDSSATGNFQVQYLTAGTCVDSVTFSITINPVDSSIFAYSQARYCQYDANPLPIIPNGTSGTFTVNSPKLVFKSASTGEVNLSASVAGIYQIQYLTNGSCPDSSKITFRVDSVDNPAFSYASSQYCKYDLDPTPNTIPGINGLFSNASGVAINQNTGEIDLSASATGTHTIKFITDNVRCPDSATFVVTIDSIVDATFAYDFARYCKYDVNPLPTTAQGVTGIFKSTTGLVFADANSGEINLATSTHGTYTIEFVANGVCPDSSEQEVTIDSVPNPAFTYAKTSFCQDEVNPLPTKEVNIGGLFKSTTGLVFASGGANGEVNLTASTPGTYTITFVTNNRCPDSATFEITINPVDDATFVYSTNRFCAYSSDPSPTTVTGITGVFRANSTNLVWVDSNLGTIDLDSSLTGNYTITFFTDGICADTFSRLINIVPGDDPAFDFDTTVYCKDEPSNPVANRLGGSNGVFTSTPAGLVFADNANGVINLDLSNANTYTIKFVTDGECPDSSTFNVTINAKDNPAFAYGNARYCNNESNPSPNITGGATGLFKSTTGLVFEDASKGEINLSASAVGTYSISFVTNGPCPDSSDVTVSIDKFKDATFSFVVNSFCQYPGASNPIPNRAQGDPKGDFTASPQGLVFKGIDGSKTGQIDVTNSTPGRYTIEFITNDPHCSDMATFVVTINPKDNPVFSYGSTRFCQNEMDPTPSKAASGTFKSSNGLIFIDTLTGQIDVSASTAGEYNVLFVTNVFCPDSSTLTINIDTVSDPTFNYAKPRYCVVENNPAPTIIAAAGTFTSNPTGLIFLNDTTGEINIDQSSAGVYQITFTTNDPYCPESLTQELTINELDNALFSYDKSTYCEDESNPGPTISGESGAFSATPAGLVFINTTTGQINLKASTFGTYTITYTTNGPCPNSSTKSVTISDTIVPVLQGLPELCNYDDTVLLIANLLGGIWSGDGVVDSVAGIFNPKLAGPGLHQITYFINSGCNRPASFVVSVKPTPDVDFSFKAGAGALTIDFTSFVSVVSGTYTYTWNFGDRSGTSNEKDPSHIYAQPNSYVVCLTVSTTDLCDSTICKNVNVFPTGISEELVAGVEVKAYPNPVSDMVNVVITEQGDYIDNDATISVLDITGRLVLEKVRYVKGIETYRLNVTGLENGIYTVVVHDKEQRYGIIRIHVLH